MSTTAFTEEQLKNAVALYAQALQMTEPSDVPEPVFSEGFKHRCRQNSALAAGFLKDKKRAVLRRVFRSAAAVLVIILISFASLMAFCTPVRATVIRWYMEVRDKVVQLKFNHSEDDHAFIICTPGELPEGFECVNTLHVGQYCRKIYKNPETGNYIHFEYMKATEKRKADIEKTGKNAEQHLVFEYYKMYLTNILGTYKLCWYDPDRELVFYVQSDLDKDILVCTFSTIDFRLPLYEPMWLPEGYTKETITFDYPSTDILYSNHDQTSRISFNIYETSSVDTSYITKGVQAQDDVVYEEHLINGRVVYYFPGSEHEKGSDIIAIYEDENLVFIVSATIPKQELLSIVESIQCIEPDW